MGIIGSSIRRKLGNYNIENRAQKAISRKKKLQSPMYESVRKQIEIADKVDPHFKVVSAKRDIKLNENLKQVFVSNISEGKEIDSRSDPNRPLPVHRVVVEDFELGYYDPEQVEFGKVSLKQAIELISKHSTDPKKYNVQVIAEEYKIDPKLAANILEYYKLFELYDEEADKRKLNYSLLQTNSVTVMDEEDQKENAKK